MNNSPDARLVLESCSRQVIGLSNLLKLHYHDSITDAVADLGSPEAISALIAGFQKYLYQEVG